MRLGKIQSKRTKDLVPHQVKHRVRQGGKELLAAVVGGWLPENECLM